jgi:hypothetical protein
MPRNRKPSDADPTTDEMYELISRHLGFSLRRKNIPPCTLEVRGSESRAVLKLRSYDYRSGISATLYLEGKAVDATGSPTWNPISEREVILAVKDGKIQVTKASTHPYPESETIIMAEFLALQCWDALEDHLRTYWSEHQT